jgi:hypothetical protein
MDELTIRSSFLDSCNVWKVESTDEVDVNITHGGGDIGNQFICPVGPTFEIVGSVQISVTFATHIIRGHPESENFPRTVKIRIFEFCLLNESPLFLKRVTMDCSWRLSNIEIVSFRVVIAVGQMLDTIGDDSFSRLTLDIGVVLFDEVR